MQAMRDAVHRPVYEEDPAARAEFERDFPYEPTPDQLAAFAAVEVCVWCLRGGWVGGVWREEGGAGEGRRAGRGLSVARWLWGYV